MSEDAARDDLRARGIWRIAPGLWCDSTTPDLIAVAAGRDTARDVHAALERAGRLPPRK